MNEWGAFNRAIKELLPHKFRMFASVLAVVIRSILLMLPPLLTKQLIDIALVGSNHIALWEYSVGSVLVTIVVVLLILADLWASSYVQGVAANIRTGLYGDLLHQPTAFYRNNKTGDLLSRLLQDSQSFTDLFYDAFGGGVVGTAAWAITTGVIGVVAMLWLNVPLTLLCLALYTLNIPVTIYVGRLAEETGHTVTKCRSSLSEMVREAVTGISYVKAAGLSGAVGERFEYSLAAYEQAQLRSVLLARWADIIQVLPGVLGVGLIYWLGAHQVQAGNLSLGGLVAFSTYAVWLQSPVAILNTTYVRVRSLLPAVGRTFAYLNHEVTQEQPKERPQHCNGQVWLDNVTFGYDPEQPILRGLSLKIAPGEVVAVVGASGAGKSTLSDLLLGLIEPQSGRVMLDGRDLSRLDSKWLRRHVCSVSQDVTVLNNTVAVNVRYGAPEASPDELKKACEDAGLTGVLAALPKGMETQVGERGTQLSSGQRQRLSIARACLYDPRILILDEATSNLDSDTEKVVMKSLRRRFSGRTLIIIAHRLSTILDADRIIVLEQGRTVEQGTHEQLLEQRGVYHALYSRECQT